MCRRILSLLLSLVFVWKALSAGECCELDPLKSRCGAYALGAHQFFIGPELYYAKREREGGTHQSGGVAAVRLGYEHIKRYKFYWGVDALYGSGRLKGKTGEGVKIKSKLTDSDIEGRFGYTFQQKCGYRFAFTPYVGCGYGEEKNAFISPSPSKVHLKICYGYVPVGFLSQATLSSLWMIGLNFKAKFLFDAKNKVSHDPVNDSLKMVVKEEIHYRVELPVTYIYSDCLGFSLVPFYEFRKYGGQANYPFNFLETKWNLFGATFKLIYFL